MGEGLRTWGLTGSQLRKHMALRVPSTLHSQWPSLPSPPAQTTQGNSNVHFLETVNCRSLAQGTPGMVDGFDTEIQCSGIRFWHSVKTYTEYWHPLISASAAFPHSRPAARFVGFRQDLERGFTGESQSKVLKYRFPQELAWPELLTVNKLQWAQGCQSSFIFLMVVNHILYKMYHCNHLWVYTAVALSTFAVLCNYPHYLFPQFSSPQTEVLCSLSNNSHSFLPLSP